MPKNLYDFTIPAFTKTLEMLRTQLEKAKAHNETIFPRDTNAILNDRLVFDQFPLIRQVQIVCDTAKNQSAALAGVEAPVYEDSEKTFDEVHARIDKTLAFLKTLTPEQFTGKEDAVIAFKYAPGMGMKAGEQVLAYTLPNFYFHAATAYSILRKNGVQIGKMDFLGALPLVAIAE